ncbi:hypothetical protein GLOTRDRAFT_92875 [Gloeophyllum trabeum ATCC 11539]|uniref:Uncharacterized protein n=1 Tax=Gloeophyllum trabeum (strain ATCC 11539 / FP-39264 / Madison 617) TaxID=670483 RepID=S7Q8V4_GLOTA|nr:uncharacterized protein GLOTRDRAFT_92875 [Gloeophyllum trabeum ATCC 11539]EPQ56411.1 hypothetical protein GLOTRDRAFT_92875 [Gloeophyllum trabeum ATCC 11539]
MNPSSQDVSDIDAAVVRVSSGAASAGVDVFKPAEVLSLGAAVIGIPKSDFTPPDHSLSLTSDSRPARYSLDGWHHTASLWGLVAHDQLRPINQPDQTRADARLVAPAIGGSAHGRSTELPAPSAARASGGYILRYGYGSRDALNPIGALRKQRVLRDVALAIRSRRKCGGMSTAVTSSSDAEMPAFLTSRVWAAPLPTMPPGVELPRGPHQAFPRDWSGLRYSALVLVYPPLASFALRGHVKPLFL